jgi:nucleoside-diphosphate-sugar epimerase
MNSPSDFLGVAPWVIITGIISWIGSMYATRAKARKDAIDQSDRLEVHRDELTLAIIRTGREEISAARIEVEDLRDEVKKLRAMETHFYHFQQSLDHLEALLSARTPEERETAERNARAFLNRMRRLQEAKGTIANEVQYKASEIELLDRDTKLGKDKKDGR